MLESGIGRAHNIALSTLENFRLPGDVSASKRYWKEDIIEPEVEVRADGMIAIRDAPGTGYRRPRRLNPEVHCAGRNVTRAVARVRLSGVTKSVNRVLISVSFAA